MRLVPSVKRAEQELADQSMVAVYPAEANLVVLENESSVDVDMGEAVVLLRALIEPDV